MVAQVEETFPDLPQLVQAALNSSHTAAQEQAEMEIMAPKGPQSIPHNVHRFLAMGHYCGPSGRNSSLELFPYCCP